jgi:hypothetical protein
MKLRFEDESLLVALPPEEFGARIRELAGDDEARKIDPICGRIIFCRGDLPEAPKLWRERLWWFLSVVAAGVFFYGLYSISLRLIEVLGK